MNNLVKNLEDILPHSHPMILIDKLIEADAQNNLVKCSVTVSEDKILYDKNIEGICALAGIEFMAQSAGCYMWFKNNMQKPKIGYLLGSRAYRCNLEKFELGKTYIITAQQVFNDNELVSFDCFIYNGNEECARATINVYQPKSAQA